jgi:hypothetical protein
VPASGLVDDEDDAAATLVLLGGEQRLGLSDQFGFLGTRTGTQRVNDGQVQTTRAEGWSGDVDNVVRGRIQLAGGCASATVLPTPTSPVMTPIDCWPAPVWTVPCGYGSYPHRRCTKSP